METTYTGPVRRRSSTRAPGRGFCTEPSSGVVTDIRQELSGLGDGSGVRHFRLPFRRFGSKYQVTSGSSGGSVLGPYRTPTSLRRYRNSGGADTVAEVRVRKKIRDLRLGTPNPFDCILVDSYPGNLSSLDSVGKVQCLTKH